MHGAAPGAAGASRSLRSVKPGESPADDELVTSVAYESDDDDGPVSPELALVDPALAERLRVELTDPEPEPERAAAAPVEPPVEPESLPDVVGEPAVEVTPPELPEDVEPIEAAPPTDAEPDDEPAVAAEPQPASARVHVLRPVVVEREPELEPAAPEAVLEPPAADVPALVPVPASSPEPAPQRPTVVPQPVVQFPTVAPAGVGHRPASVSPLRRRSRGWHLLVVLATVVLFAGVVAIGVTIVSSLTEDDAAAPSVTATGDPPATGAPQAGNEEPATSPAPSGSGAATAQPRRFAWAPVEGAVSYRFELFRGDEQVLQATTTDPAYELPTSWRHEGREERLTSGSYRWYVWPVLASGPADAAIVQAKLDVP